MPYQIATAFKFNNKTAKTKMGIKIPYWQLIFSKAEGTYRYGTCNGGYK